MEASIARSQNAGLLFSKNVLDFYLVIAVCFSLYHMR